MKTIKYLFINITLVFLLGGCDFDQYLDLYPETSLTVGIFYKNEAQMKAAVDDVYRQMGRLFDAHSIPCIYGTLFSDDGSVIAQLAGTPVDEPIDRHEITSHNSRIEDAWSVCYNVIFNTNNLIHQLEIVKFEIDPSLKSRMLGEIKLVRSLAYFNLVRAFGDVPLITEPITPEESYNYLRESSDEIYNQIITDLTFAKSNLPESYSGSDIGRVTRYSAAGILAKVYLTIGNSTAAKSELEFIINSNRFSLDANNDGIVNEADYQHLFAFDTKNCKSSILEAQYMSGTNARNSSHQSAYSPYLDSWRHPLIDYSISRGGGVNTPSDDLESEFEDGDPRKAITVVPGFYTFEGFYVDYPFTLKYFDPNWFNAGQNFEIIRYADILLMYAEVTGDATYLNMVRDRVGMPPFGSNEYPSHLYSTLELAIEHERRVELALEMHRMFDLIRTGRAVTVMATKAPGFKSDRLLFPIPIREIDTNPLLTQNPGY